MKILIFNHVYYPYQKGGAEISTQLLAESLVNMGHEVHVCTTAPEDKKEIINGVTIHRTKERNIYWSFNNDDVSAIKKLLWHTIEIYNIFNKTVIRRIIESVKPDVIHTNVISGFSTIVWQVANTLKIPIVHTLRDYYLMCIKATRFDGNKVCERPCVVCKYYSIPKRIVSANVDAVIGISSFILEKHINNGYFPNAKIKSVIHNPVNSYVKNKGINKRKVIGYLGRVHPSKGIEKLISAFLSINTLGYYLEIAGGGDPDYISHLKTKYNDKRIRFIGRVEPYDFLSTIELLVVPSLWEEPFGRVIVEANSCGCPVLVSNRGGMPELIEEDVNGSVFDLYEDDSLKNKLNGFIKKEISYNLKNMDMKGYEKDFIAKQYIEIYSQICG